MRIVDGETKKKAGLGRKPRLVREQGEDKARIRRGQGEDKARTKARTRRGPRRGQGETRARRLPQRPVQKARLERGQHETILRPSQNHPETIPKPSRGHPEARARRLPQEAGATHRADAVGGGGVLLRDVVARGACAHRGAAAAVHLCGDDKGRGRALVRRAIIVVYTHGPCLGFSRGLRVCVCCAGSRRRHAPSTGSRCRQRSRCSRGRWSPSGSPKRTSRAGSRAMLQASEEGSVVRGRGVRGHGVGGWRRWW